MPHAHSQVAALGHGLRVLDLGEARASARGVAPLLSALRATPTAVASLQILRLSRNEVRISTASCDLRH